MDVIIGVFRDIMNAFTEYIWHAAIFGVVAFIADRFIYKMRTGITMKDSVRNFFGSSKLIYRLMFYVYAYFVLDYTLIGRQSASREVFGYVLDGWKLKNSYEGAVYYDAIENLIFFIPLLFFLIKAFDWKNVYKKFHISTGKYLANMQLGLIVAFTVSCFIEVMQAVSGLGYFQLSDIVYNTAGGVIGALIAGINFNINRNREDV